MTTILISQMRNLRHNCFPKVAVLVLADLVCSKPDPLASAPLSHIAVHLPVPWTQWETVLGPSGRGTVSWTRYPSLIFLVWEKVMWTRCVCCATLSPLSGPLLALHLPWLACPRGRLEMPII